MHPWSDRGALHVTAGCLVTSVSRVAIALRVCCVFRVRHGDSGYTDDCLYRMDHPRTERVLAGFSYVAAVRLAVGMRGGSDRSGGVSLIDFMPCGFVRKMGEYGGPR